ncbi:hypothetical protein PBCV1_a224L [Paramecium bursaria Chlorella virus 1]|uniref:Uncharacterized protein n=1 Tax=Paramecium bursaria Chlorella virus 1 TaxID=10506 RepID=Q84544_PBCV1|nr:hypothetical protein PBCV1_a224L [Paramecium bursaria Chlorella virus 1]AAC96592.1 hypothetical protein [Paramecium bursaria Chlorella virus 1]
MTPAIIPIAFQIGLSVLYTNRSNEKKGVSRGRSQSFLRMKMLYPICAIMIGPEYTRRLPKVSTHVSSEEHQELKNTVGPIDNQPYNVK